MSIRTGNGDLGDTFVGSKSFRKAHVLVQYIATLDVMQSFSTALPLKWGKFEPRDLFQQSVYILSAVPSSKKPREFELNIQELSILMENQIEFISSSLSPLKSFIKNTDSNTALNQLRTCVRTAEIACVLAHDTLEMESNSLNENILFMLKNSIKFLNIMSDWVFMFIWVYSTDEQNKVHDSLIFEPWSIDKIKSLNT